MSKYIIYAIVKNRRDLEEIVHKLQHAGIPVDDISFLSQSSEFPELNKGQRDWRQEKRETHAKNEVHTKASEGATAGAATGGVIGGALGLLAGLGMFILPGLSPLLAAGPLLGALSGIGAGGTLGSLLGALIGNKIPEHDSKYFEKRIKEGAMLLTVHVATDEQEKQVQNILSKYSGDEITSVKLPEKSQSKR